LGNYASGSGETYLNPMTGGVIDTAWKVSTIAWNINETTPSTRLPGTIGDIIFYPADDGPYKET